jgi:hypothetical protein
MVIVPRPRLIVRPSAVAVRDSLYGDPGAVGEDDFVAGPVLADQVALGIGFAGPDRCPAPGRGLLGVDHGAGDRMPEEAGARLDHAAGPGAEEGAEVEAGSADIEVVLVLDRVAAQLGEGVLAQIRDAGDRGLFGGPSAALRRTARAR